MTRHEELSPELRERPFAVAEGYARAHSEKRMRGGDLARPFHGVRSVDDPASNVSSLCRAYVPRMTPGQAFSHSTAAHLWGMPLPYRVQAQPTIHVSTFDDRNRPRLRGVRGHQLSDPALRLVVRDGLRVLDVGTVWLQLAMALTVDELVAVADYIVLTPRKQTGDDVRPYLSLDRLGDRVRRYRGRGRRNALMALELARDGSESPRETALRLALGRHRLPEPALNLEILNEHGFRIGYGDLVYPEFRVVVEYEGEQHRTDSKQFFADIERHEALVRAGWIHLRETKETPASGPRSTPWRTGFALHSRGWRS
ncbi:hypothetical protein VD659_13280 [Herbiconiux sp. 11R-BC]|uniref:hypothetical protein n=1 Tax=Herbiconiux sp. 11R-BC TaxID=3111637 RepID=UPI003C046FFF